MRASKIIILFLPAFLLFSCTKEREITKDVTVENVVYGLSDVALYTNSAEKTKQKNSSQYISIVYSDLFNKTIPVNELNDLSEISLAIGDKQMASEMIIGNYLNKTGVSVPSNTAMRADIDDFVNATYLRFYSRKPTELEKYYFKNTIQNDTTLTPEVIYTAFTLSNEYWFY